MRAVYDAFLRPYWMELLGLSFLAVSLFVAGQFLVDVGFALLLAGTILNGIASLIDQYRRWRLLSRTIRRADFPASPAYDSRNENLEEQE
jgi:hypothetical protein